jgi:CDP-2,3-bis-(O-geranylgeranyl)-sn-glycerol synthase
MPGYFANMAPPIAKRFNFLGFLDKPLDNNKKINGKPILGKNKTYRGFVVGIIAAIFAVLIQKILFNINDGENIFRILSLGIDYTNISLILLLAILMGFGALAGDSIESFFKRRINIKSGQSFIPWDQIDHILGAYLFSLILIYSFISWKIFFSSIILGFILHVVVNHISFYLGIRSEKW